MRRAASQITFCSPDKILRRNVVELNEQGTISRLFSLDNNRVESSQTLFYDGIISSEIISLKERSIIIKELSDYNYIDLSGELPTTIEVTNKPLILDFGTNSNEKVTRVLQMLTPILEAFSIFEIIAACCYFPAEAIGETAKLDINRKTKPILWERADLVNKRITDQINIRGLF
jgi:hypothetical protein